MRTAALILAALALVNPISAQTPILEPLPDTCAKGDRFLRRSDHLTFKNDIGVTAYQGEIYRCDESTHKYVQELPDVATAILDTFEGHLVLLVSGPDEAAICYRKVYALECFPYRKLFLIKLPKPEKKP